uniref:Hsp70-binding protein 1 n=1 Tax=Sus scrofa TaxID=9823 RepID=A0A8D1QKI7_PIG
MADQGSGGSRLPLALPPASQGCSSGGSGSSAGGSGNPPPPRNLQGLLQMAITAGSEEPDPPPEPMSEERRQWLQEAMSAAFRGQREEVEQMKNCLRVLSQPTPSSAGEAELAADQQEREGALELLADLCENMDNAADFCQLSGMHLLVGRYLEAGPAGLRWRAAQLIGTCSQNVAAIQEQVLGLGALRKLLRLLDRDPCDSVRVKALFAISCLVREQEAGLLQFLRLDGFSVLMRAMQQQVQKLKVKSAFLLQNLLVGHPEHKGTLCSMGMVQQLVALVRTEHSPFHEHVLGALCRCAGAQEAPAAGDKGFRVREEWESGGWPSRSLSSWPWRADTAAWGGGGFFLAHKCPLHTRKAAECAGSRCPVWSRLQAGHRVEHPVLYKAH